jgi:GNAT superfamily N-acetyltransferase
MADFVSKPLDPATWPAFADLVEQNNGVWGGCWCMGFHPEGVWDDTTPALNRERKLGRVNAGTTHAALVFDGDECVGWCQFGPPAELPRIKHKRAYDSEPVQAPDWRITCFFVGKGHRRQGVAAAALAGALGQIADLGGGLVESFPEDTTDRKVSGSFLHNANLALFEQNGFERTRKLGKNRWLVQKKVATGA